MSDTTDTALDQLQLAGAIKQWGRELGFGSLGITDVALDRAEQRLRDWLCKGFHGEMDYMARHGTGRSRPADLVPGTLRVISARMDYWPGPPDDPWNNLERSDLAYVSRYALGRDYHKLVRKRLQRLAARLAGAVGAFGYRVFCDSAPVLEKPLAEQAGLGWIGKHTNLIARKTGSWFFLGEIYTDLPLPIDRPAVNHCGTCTACIQACPTGAIVAPYQLDARLCISYLTIELRGTIPVELRPLIGNRIFGCDDCQLVCPWNRFARPATEPAFSPRPILYDKTLIELFRWTEQQFLRRTEGSAIRRIGYAGWLRNIAVAMGNARYSARLVAALRTRLAIADAMVAEHVSWALEQQLAKAQHESVGALP